MAESDPALNAPEPDSTTANIRVAGVENRLGNADRLAHLEARLAALETLREHFNAILSEKDRAIEMATGEREKAASALRVALERTILEGDDRLREHIANQVMQIREALVSANLLELERVAGVNSAVLDVKSSAEAALRDAQLAQSKFEDGVRERFTQVNEFRGALDDLGKSMGTRRELEIVQEGGRTANATMSREINELRSRIDLGPKALGDLQTRSDQSVGAAQRGKEFMAWAFSAAAIGVALVAVVVSLTH